MNPGRRPLLGRRVAPGALRHRNFRLFAAGQLVSLAGTWMQNVAQAWLVYRLSGSPALLGLIGFTSQIPIFLLSPLGGIVADRFSRHRVVLLAQLAAMALALVLALRTLTGAIALWEIFTLAALLGAVNGFDMPARQSFLPQLVPPADLTGAIALYAAIFNGARIVGPALAGLVVGLVGEGWCFLGNAVSYLAVLLGLALIRLDTPAPSRAQRRVWCDLKEGFGFAGRTWPLRTLLLGGAAIGLAGGPHVALMPIYADRILGGGPYGLGLLMGAAGVGALLGTAVLGLRGSPAVLWRWISRALCGFGLLLMLFAGSRLFWLSAFLLTGVGFCLLIGLTSINTLIQSLVPDRLRGRVMAIYSMTVMGATPIGALLAGALAEAIGAQWTTALGGSVAVAASFYFAREVDRMRTATRAGAVLVEGGAHPLTFA